MNTTSVSFSCPTDDCGDTHSATVRKDGHDRAEEHCYTCGNNVVVKTRNAEVVETEVL